MPRKPQPWFRFYVETMNDRKIRRLTPAERWAWAGVLAAAKESAALDGAEPGQLLIMAGVPMTASDLADYADVPVRNVKSALAKMAELGMVATADDGLMTVVNFSRRQFESDNVTARTTAHRERSNEHRKNVPTNDEGTTKERSNDDGRNDVGTASSRGRGRARRADREQITNSSNAVGLRNAPREPSPGTIPKIIRSYVAACRDAGVAAPEESQARVERSARSLLAQGYDLEAVEAAARNAAVGGWTDLATQLQRDTSRASPATNSTTTSTADARFQQGLDIADQLERKALG